MRVVTVAQMREIEATAETRYGLAGPTLMAQAGASAAELLRGWLGGDVEDTRVLVLVGPGNNGGDGRILADHLLEWGAAVIIYDWATRTLQPTNQTVDVDWSAPDALERVLVETDVVVDALLGIGVSRPLSDEMQAVNRQIRTVRLARGHHPHIVAVDLPSGANADTGAVSPGTLAADVTITLGAPKIGLFAYPLAAYMGDLLVGGIGLPAEMDLGGIAEFATPADLAPLLPPRPPDSNKGTYGKAVIVAGSPRFPGAALLAATAAGRIGAGLVTIATTPELARGYMGAFPEATYALFSPDLTERAGAILTAVPGSDALLIGPGLDQQPGTREWLLEVLAGLRALPDDQRPRLIIDADGLNLLSHEPDWWGLLPPRTVLTPHPGEMARLLGHTRLPDGSVDRLVRLRELAASWDHIILLKGAITTVVAPSGPHHDRPWLNYAPNPAMAAAGMGDVLAGIIVGLLAQGMAPEDAAIAGAYLHSAAGRLAVAALGSDVRAGLVATDLAAQLPRARARLQPPDRADMVE
ncbi:MAG: NAD(P)H-hydrate dehydratase [Ktedonobacterales bacterium]|nr:NAD(P)H-hydrate dehydratase [Ktedonobacterales bacterium]